MRNRLERAVERVLGFLLLAAIGVLVAGLLGGCGSVTGCTEDRRTVEVSYGAWYDADQAKLRLLADKGWDCHYEGAIRDAWGRPIGGRYACTACR